MRRLFAVASAFSLLVCITAAVADVASRLTTFGWTSSHNHWSRGLFEKAATTHNHYLIASKGILYDMGEESSDAYLAGRPFVDEHRILSHNDLQGLNRDATFHGYSWHVTRQTWESGRYTWRHWQRSAPLWLFVLLCAILPAWWLLIFLRARKRAARIRSGQCPNCGYDLRASAERCPECGMPINQRSSEVA